MKHTRDTTHVVELTKIEVSQAILEYVRDHGPPDLPSGKATVTIVQDGGPGRALTGAYVKVTERNQ